MILHGVLINSNIFVAYIYRNTKHRSAFASDGILRGLLYFSLSFYLSTCDTVLLDGVKLYMRCVFS